jgi:dUTP pyrophosphatase
MKPISKEGNKMQIKVKMIDVECMPKMAHHGDACYDCRSRVDFTVQPHSVEAVPLGFFIQLPVSETESWEAQIRPRSGLSLKKVTIGNAPGTIDANFTGEVKAIVANNSDEPFVIKQYDRICQMRICVAPVTELIGVDEIEDTNRGANGFGSSGVK